MKRIYTIVSLLAVINLIGLVAVSVFAWKRGWLEGDRLAAAWSALRGEVSVVSEEPPEPAVAAAEPPRTSEERIRRQDDGEERMRIELDRRRREIQDAWALLERQQLAVVQAREELEDAKKRHAAELEERAKREGLSGAQKELEIIQDVNPKVAKDLLILKDEADAIRILMSMSRRKAKKIVEEFKSAEERRWIGRILEKLSESDAAQAEALAAGTME